MKLMANCILIMLFLLLLPAFDAFAGQVIDYNGYSVIASSVWKTERRPEHVINGSGLSNPVGDLGVTHIAGSSGNNYSWHTDYNGGGSANGIVEHSWLIFDLGGLYTLESMNVWNYNHPGDGGTETTRSIRRFNLWVRTDDSAGNNVANSNQPFKSTGWTLVLNNALLQPAPGLSTYTGQSVWLGGISAQRAAIEILSNYEGYDVTGDGNPDTDPFGPLAGCSEVRFFQTTGLILIEQTGGNTRVSEDGTITDEINIRLLQQSLSEVRIYLEDAAEPNQLVLGEKMLIFTTENWDDVQSVFVGALDDNLVESDPHYLKITGRAESQSQNFNGIVFNIDVEILENDCGAWGFDPMDMNFDCRVDLQDFAGMAARWLACSVPNDPDCERFISQTSTILPTAYQLPPITPLFDTPMRDTCILLGPDGTYYLTGTTGYPTWWTSNDGIRMYKSSDLVHWTLMDQPGGTDGLIWNIQTEGTWAKQWVDGKRAVWAPEVHYINGTYWIPYCMNYRGTGLLKSTTGLPQGPYADVKTDGPLTGEIDASLFQDEDGKVYFIWQNGKIWQMNVTMTGFVGSWQLLSPSNNGDVGFEAAFIRKINGRYYLGAASNDSGRYDFMVASADNILGPYGKRDVGIPYAGHNVLFWDKNGQIYSTFFGNNPTAPFRERAAFLPAKMDENGEIIQVVDDVISTTIHSWRYTTTAPAAEWTKLGFDDTGWTSGTSGFGAISVSGSVVRTEWNSLSIWMRRKFELDGPLSRYQNLKLYLFHTGNTEVYLNNQKIAETTGNTSSYVSIPLDPDVSQALLVGTNVIAVHCDRSGVSQYIDVGLSCGQ